MTTALTRGRVGTLAHLARRFFGDLKPGGPAAADEAWAETQLLAGEVALWRRMSDADRRHAVGVARRTDALLAGGAPRPVLAAALLHDVGKIEAAIGPWRRALARTAAAAFGRARVAAGDGRFARYLNHGRIGGDLLARAGSDPLTRAWAAEHHLPESRWTIPAQFGHALRAADDD